MIHDARIEFCFDVPNQIGGTVTDSQRAAIRNQVRTRIVTDVPRAVRDAWAAFGIHLTGTETNRRAQWQAVLDDFIVAWNTATGAAHSYAANSLAARYWVVDGQMWCQHHYQVDGGWTVSFDHDSDGTPTPFEIRLAITVKGSALA